MTECYRIHFGFSKSKRYSQALELAELANKHEVFGEDKHIWHIVTFTPDQLDLMALFYLTIPGKLNVNPEVEYRIWQEDMIRVNEKLREEGYIKTVDPVTGEFKPAWKKPQEHLPQYRKIRELISKGEHEKAVKKYYDSLGENYYGDFHGELIYLKRIGRLPLRARDLLYFRAESSRGDFVHANISEYMDCINRVLEKRQSAGMKSPLDIIIENAPTLEEMIKRKEHERHDGIRLMPGEWKRDNSLVTMNSLSFMVHPTF